MLRWIIIMSLIASLLSPVFGKPRNYAVLRHDFDVTVVQINPAAFQYTAYKGTPPYDKHTLSFNASYFDPTSGRTIGLLYTDGKWVDTITAYHSVRPCFWVKSGKAQIGNFCNLPPKPDLVIQAGPTLLKHGVCVLPHAIEFEQFQPDAVCQRRQLAIGITKRDKVILLCSRNWDLYRMTKELVKCGCVEAMKLDGGPSVHLWLTPDDDDRTTPEVRLGTALVHCGVYFTGK